MLNNRQTILCLHPATLAAHLAHARARAYRIDNAFVRARQLLLCSWPTAPSQCPLALSHKRRRSYALRRASSQRMVATVRRVRAGRDSRTEARTAPVARRRLIILSFSISMNRASCSRLTIKKSRMNGISRSPSTPCATAAPPRLPTHWQRARSATSMDHMRPQNTPSAPRNISHSCRWEHIDHQKTKLNLATKVLARCTMRPH